MKYINVIKKEANLNLLKNIPNNLEVISGEYKDIQPPCIVKEDDSGNVLKVYRTIEDYNFSLLPLEAQQSEIIKQIQLKYEAERVNAKGVPPEEEKTWDRQREEYEAYITNNTSPTPAIDGLVAGDNAVGGTITKTELITKIGQNIENYIVTIAYITGLQHGLERRVKACTTQEELDLIDINFVV